MSCLDTLTPPSSNRKLIYIKLTVTAILWGGTFVAGRIVSTQAGPFSAALLRFMVASAVLLPLLLVNSRSFPRLTAKQFYQVSLLGLSGIFLYNYFFFSGLERIQAGRASLIIASSPGLIALFAALFLREQLNLTKIIGIFLAIFGAMIVVTRGHLSQLLKGGIGSGELYILGAVASWVFYSLVGKATMKDLPPLTTVTYACLIGTLLLILPALGEGLTTVVWYYSANVWIGILFLGWCGTVLGFVWYYQGIKIIGASQAGVFINLVPISAIVLAFFILDESLDISLLVGGSLVTIGVYFTNKPRSRVVKVNVSVEASEPRSCVS